MSDEELRLRWRLSRQESSGGSASGAADDGDEARQRVSKDARDLGGDLTTPSEKSGAFELADRFTL